MAERQKVWADGRCDQQSHRLPSVATTCAVALVIPFVLFSNPTTVLADPLVPDVNTFTSLINGASNAGHRGVIGVNVSAGDENLQANGISIAIGPEGVTTASGLILQSQPLASDSMSASTATEARIGENAFSNSFGAIAINQVSGSANAQANSVVVSVGQEWGQTIDEGALEQMRADVTPPGEPSAAEEPAERFASVDNSAFSSISGIVQFNQAVGTGNATGNSFGFRVLNHGP